MNNYQLDCCQEQVVMQHWRPGKVKVSVCVPTHLFDMSMLTGSFSECAPRAVEHAVMAVKYGTLVNPLLQSLTSVLVNLSANYKVATWIKWSSNSPLFFSVGPDRSRMRDVLTFC